MTDTIPVNNNQFVITKLTNENKQAWILKFCVLLLDSKIYRLSAYLLCLR